MKLLVLGSSGFIGNSLIHYLLSQKEDDLNIIGIDVCALKDLKLSIVFEQCNVTNDSALISILDKYNPSYVINTIGIFASNDFSLNIALNVKISQTILEYYANKNDHGLKKIVLIGSAAEYGFPKSLPVKETDETHPVNFYGLSKLYQTMLAGFYYENYKLPVVVVRPFNLKGEGISDKLAYGAFVKKVESAEDGGTITTGNLSSYRDYLDISDVCKMLFAALKKGRPGEIYNICSGEAVLTRDLLMDIIHTSGKKLLIQEGSVKKAETDVDKIFGDNSKILGLWND